MLENRGIREGNKKKSDFLKKYYVKLLTNVKILCIIRVQ